MKVTRYKKRFWAVYAPGEVLICVCVQERRRERRPTAANLRRSFLQDATDRRSGEMLITTHCGIVVNSDHIACVVMQKALLTQEPPESTPADTPTFKVLLCMANGMTVVAARHLSETAARFLRQEIATRWTEGAPSVNVCEALTRHAEGAYYAEEFGTRLHLVEGGE